MAAQDSLTGLEAGGPELRQLLSSTGTWCCFVDVDGLIWLNAEFGHAEGDRAMATVARATLELVAEAGGRTFRVGGDEVLAVCPSGERHAMLRMAQGIVERVRALKIPYRRTDRPHRTQVEVNATVFVGAMVPTGPDDRGLPLAFREAIAERTWRAKQESKVEAGLVTELS